MQKSPLASARQRLFRLRSPRYVPYMFKRKVRGVVPYRIDTSALSQAPRQERWRVIIPEVIGGIFLASTLLAAVYVITLIEPYMRLGDFLARLSHGQ